MKKKRIIFIIFSALIIISFLSVVFTKQESVNIKFPKKLLFSDIYEIYKEDIDHVSKLLIRSGLDGKSYITSDKDKINEFFRIMNKAKFTKHKNQGVMTGWTYYVDLYMGANDDEWLRIGFSRVSFDKYYSKPNYKVVNSPYYLIDNNTEIMDSIKKYYLSLQSD